MRPPIDPWERAMGCFVNNEGVGKVQQGVSESVIPWASERQMGQEGGKG